MTASGKQSNKKTDLAPGPQRRVEELESALKDCETRFRYLIDHANDAIYRTDVQGHFTYFNPTAAVMMKFSGEEILGQRFTEFIPETHRTAVEKFYGRQFVKRIKNTYNEIPVLSKDGTVIWLGQNVQLIVEQGEPVGFQAIARDISQRKKTEDALRESEEKFSKAFHASPSMMSITGLSDGHYQEINDAFLAFTGYGRDELIGRTIKELKLWVDDNDPAVFYNILSKVGSIRNREVRVRVKKGDIRTALVSSDAIDISGEKHVLTVGTDITERKRSDQMLQEGMEKLRKSIDMIIEAMALTVESRDPYTAGHQRRVANLARAMASEMGLSAHQIDGIRMAGVIHDLGKITIPAEILSKPGKLSAIEFSLIKIHPQAGYDILKRIDFPWPVADIVFQHHERINGSGYPRSLKENEIIIEARIIAVADVVEAIASHRPYRSSLGLEAALDEISSNKGVLYDVFAVDACLKIFRKDGFKLDLQ